MGKKYGEIIMLKDTQLAFSLREKLGSESTGKWIEFMDSVGASLPFLLRSAGRPTTEEIARSQITAGGFTSWRQMIETSPDLGGLGWSYDTYKAWKKAYNLVLKHPYLRDLALSSSEINTIQRENKEFPATLEAFEALKNGRKDAQEERRQNSVAALQKQLFVAKKEATEAQNGLAVSRASEAQSKSVLSQIRQDLAQSNEKIGSLQVQLEREKTTSESRKNKIQKLDESLGSTNTANRILCKYIEKLWSMNRWDLLLSFFKAQLPQLGNIKKTVTENKKS
jgi:flagellar motility protein MotE (MotC chaperone)